MSDQTTQAKPETETKSKEFKPPTADRTLSEAGGSLSGKIYALDKDGHVIAEFQATARGNTLREAIDNMLDGIAYGKPLRLHLQEPVPQAAPPKTKAPAPEGKAPAPETVRQPPPPTLAPPNPYLAPQGLPSQGGGTIKAVQLKSVMREDGRLNIEFYEAGHKWADITTTRTLGDACTLLAPIGGFTEAHLLPSQENPKPTYTISAFIDWQPGKNNGRGKPYKDIVAIRPA